jgi:hypothetical protein
VKSHGSASVPECKEAQALRNCGLELVEISRSGLGGTGVITPVVHLGQRDCLEKRAFVPGRDGIEGVDQSLLSHLALEPVAFGYWTKASS